MKTLLSLLSLFLSPATIFPMPTGIAPDSVGEWGQFGFLQNANNYSESLSSTSTSGTTATLIASGAGAAPTSGNILAGFTQFNAGFTGTAVVTLPTTAAMIAALGGTTPLDGTYSENVHLVNNSGATLSLAAGDANTTILGSTSTVTGNVRKLTLRVLNSSNITFTNLGTWTL